MFTSARTAAIKKVLSPISVTRMTTSDFSVALKKSVPPTMANSDSKTLGTPTLSSTAIPTRFNAERIDFLKGRLRGCRAKLSYR